MNRSILIAALTIALASSRATSQPSLAAERSGPAARVEFKGCVVSWTERELVIGNRHFERKWRIHDGRLIANFGRNHKLGLLFETKVGRGNLLVCASGLPALQDHPEARQLMHSLLRYLDSPTFLPKAELDGELLKKLLPGKAQ